jgi:hypothetical protein
LTTSIYSNGLPVRRITAISEVKAIATAERRWIFTAHSIPNLGVQLVQANARGCAIGCAEFNTIGHGSPITDVEGFHGVSLGTMRI